MLRYRRQGCRVDSTQAGTLSPMYRLPESSSALEAPAVLYHPGALGVPQALPLVPGGPAGQLALVGLEGLPDPQRLLAPAGQSRRWFRLHLPDRQAPEVQLAPAGQ